MTVAATTVTGTDGALIEVSGMCSGYAGVPVVRDINLHVGPGEVVALLGPNGAGKTTTLLTVSGLVKVLDGTASVLGGPVTFGSPHKMAKRGLGHVPEDRSLFFGLTVAENLKLGLRGGRHDQRERVRAGTDAAPGTAAVDGSSRGPAVGRRATDARCARGRSSPPRRS